MSASTDTPQHALEAAIDRFFARHNAAYPNPATPHDAQWRSPCETGEPFADAQGELWTRWQPVRRHPDVDDFAPLERALEFSIHADIKAHYGRYWSGNLEATAPDGHVSLLYLWNPADRERLTENLIGHAVACRHNRTPFSVFFACTEPDSDYFLTVNNLTGEVQVEVPGKTPLRVVAPCLADFMRQLQPAPPAAIPSAAGTPA